MMLPNNSFTRYILPVLCSVSIFIVSAGYLVVSMDVVQGGALLTLLVAGACVFAGGMGGWVVFSAINSRAWAVQFYVAIMVFMIDATFRRRDLSDLGIDWQSILKFSVALGALLIGVAHFNKVIHILKRPPVFWMLMYSAWACFSAVYSVTPTYTFASGVIFLSYILFSAVVASILSIDKVLIGVFSGFAVFLMLSWGFYYFVPSIGQSVYWTVSGSMVRFGGLAGQANNMGRILSLMIIFLYFLYRYKLLDHKVMAVVFAVILSTLIMTQSRTATIATALSVLIVTVRRRPVFVFAMLVLVFGGILFAQVMPTMSIDSASLSRSGNDEELWSLTGRVYIWDFVLDKIQDSPLIGYGYSGSRQVISRGWASNGWTTTTAHNMWLQSLLTVGVLGTLPLLLAVWSQLLSFLKNPYPFRDVILLFVLITGMMEASGIGPTPNILTLLWMVSVSCAEVNGN